MYSDQTNFTKSEISVIQFHGLRTSIAYVTVTSKYAVRDFTNVRDSVAIPEITEIDITNSKSGKYFAWLVEMFVVYKKYIFYYQH